MVGLGAVVDKNWQPKLFTFNSAYNYLKREMDSQLQRLNFQVVIAEFDEYFRGSYAAMPTNIHTKWTLDYKRLISKDC